MRATYDTDLFKVWTPDDLLHGPVDLSTLMAWVEEARVREDTWVHSASDNAWRQARAIAPLQGLFSQAREGTRFLHRLGPGTVQTEELRQFPIFTALANEEVEQFLRFCEPCLAEAGQVIIKKGDPGDSMFFLLSGGIRVRLLVKYEEKTLARVGAGEFFGEIAMFMQAPRSADVVAEETTRLLRLGAPELQQLTREHPAIAAQVLHVMLKVMAQRIFESTRRTQQDVASEFVWR